jgi:hypothetical protein
MKKRRCAIVALMAAIVGFVPVLAEASDACLQHNRAKNWRAVDESTLVYMDRQDKPYVVRFADRCRNLTRGDATLINRHWSGLRCLSRGDSFRVAAAGQPAYTCRIASVEAGTTG